MTKAALLKAIRHVRDEAEIVVRTQEGPDVHATIALTAVHGATPSAIEITLIGDLDAVPCSERRAAG